MEWHVFKRKAISNYYSLYKPEIRFNYAALRNLQSVGVHFSRGLLNALLLQTFKMFLPPERAVVLSPEPHHNLSHPNPGQTPGSAQKLHLGKDGTWLGFSPMKEPGGLLRKAGVSPHLKCEATRIHKYAICQILTGSLTYYMILNPEFECPCIFLF